MAPASSLTQAGVPFATARTPRDAEAQADDGQHSQAADEYPAYPAPSAVGNPTVLAGPSGHSLQPR